MNSFFANANFEIDSSVIKTMPEETFWFLLGIATLFFIYFFYRSYQALTKARTIEDTPTAKIRSAAQGYVELKGTQRCLKNFKLTAPLTKQPCTWYRYVIERYQNKGWVIVENGISEALFELDDLTGTCIIDPKGAQVEITQKDTWSGFKRWPTGKPISILGRIFSLFGSYRYHEWRMEEGKPLYAIGNFHTLTLSPSPSSVQQDDYQEAIKKSQTLWHTSFMKLLPTLPQNNKISANEWKNIISKAYQNSNMQHNADSSQESVNILSGHDLIPRTPFILSSIEEKSMISTYKREAFIWFIAYLLLMAGVSWLLIIRLQF